ncbi:MAG: hypothetical protein LAN18_10855 [Acidobacteriia bacterium]|nr:hypothetical protein [Terriglobia bacterium]
MDEDLGSSTGSLYLNWLLSFINVVRWLWRKIWDWGPLAWIVGTILIPVGIVVAQERMYGLGRTLIALGPLLLLLKILHVSIGEHKPAKEISAVFVISGLALMVVTYGGWWAVSKIEWKQEVVIKMTFKSSPVLTERTQRKIIWQINQYYLYLKKIGFELPAEIPPLGVSPSHGIISGGGSPGPTYYSSLIISEDAINNSSVLISIYSIYTFNRALVWPDAYRRGISRAEADDDEVAAWILSCYFSASFSGRNVCQKDTPGYKWVDAMWDVRKSYGQDYADGLMCFTEMMWKNLPAKYVDTFDKFFRYKLIAGESVKNNASEEPKIDLIFKQHGLDITLP